MYFQNYGLRKTWLDMCPKGPFSQDPLIGNMLNKAQHCFNPNDSTVTYLVIILNAL